MNFWYTVAIGWQIHGSVTECLDALLVVAQENKINTDSKAWPKTPAWVSRYLNKIKSNLLEGPKVEVVIKRLTADEENYKKGTSTIRIRKYCNYCNYPHSRGNYSCSGYSQSNYVLYLKSY